MLRTHFARRINNDLPLISCLLIVALLSGGCQPLKQKFIRKKKEKSTRSEFVPVLDPIWLRDFVQGVGENNSEKKMKYLVDQMIVNLTEMQRWIVEEKRAAINDHIVKTTEVRTELDKPVQLISIERLIRRIDRDGRKLMKELNPDAMEQFYIQKQ